MPIDSDGTSPDEPPPPPDPEGSDVTDVVGGVAQPELDYESDFPSADFSDALSEAGESEQEDSAGENTVSIDNVAHAEPDYGRATLDTSSEFTPPRAANDDVAGTKFDPSDGVPVIGRIWDTAAAKEWEGHVVIDLRANPNANEVWAEAHERGDKRPDGNPVTEPGWSPELNREWVNSLIKIGAVVYLGTDPFGSGPAGHNLWNTELGQPAVFADEINQLKSAGYRQIDQYMVPEELCSDNPTDT